MIQRVHNALATSVHSCLQGLLGVPFGTRIQVVLHHASLLPTSLPTLVLEQVEYNTIYYMDTLLLT